MKNKQSGLYSVFFQAKDTKAVYLAFKKAIERYEKKENKRNSTRYILFICQIKRDNCSSFT